jgi:sugar lactone lactonase YvrE
MLKRIISIAIALLFLVAPITHAKPTGDLFKITESGPPGTVNITLCLNGIGVLSCQKYTVNSLHLLITPVKPYHVYPAIGVLINTPGYTYARLGLDCTIGSSGYCIFSASSVAPAPLNFKVSTAPNVTITATPSAVTFVGDSYSQTNVGSGGTLPYVYSVVGGALPPGTALDTTTGTVSGVPTTGGPFSYTIEVTDFNFTSATATTTGIMQGGVVLTSTPSAVTEIGITYTQTNVASGGSAPYTYSISAGAVPAGTTLDPTTGTVSGTPTAAGGFSYTVLVTDSNNGTASNPIAGTIAATVTLTATPAPNTKVGVNYTQNNVASNGTTPYTYSVLSGALPTATTLNTSTGTVSGTPTTVQSFSYVIQVTDGVGATATAASSGSISYNAWSVSNIDTTNVLTSVSCPTTTMCMAVDSAGNALEYSGSWLISPIPANFDYVSVSCATPDFCVALGNSSGSGNAFVFDGTTWTASGGNPIAPGLNFVSVSCPSTTFCLAVDASGNTYTYNGTTWAAGAALGFSSLAVSCSSSSFCMVVGDTGNASSFNGTTWTSYSNIGTSNLTSVSCTPNSGSFCSAVNTVGVAFAFSGGVWNGGINIDGGVTLNGVSCLGTAFCMAVDNAGNAITYNGTSWSQPSGIDAPNALTSVSCPTSTFCVAVDGSGNAAVYNARVTDVSIGNSSGANVLTFPITATGNVAPTYTLTGGLTRPLGAYVDLNNYLWEVDNTAKKVNRYQGSDTAAATPSVSIASTGMTNPAGVVVDGSGNIYVSDTTGSIFIYPGATYQVPGTYATATPSKTINGPATGLSTVTGIALDSTNNIWVANSGNNSITEYIAGTTGGTTNLAPATTITGAATTLNNPNGIWIDSAGNIWVTNTTANTIAVFNSTASGNSAPTCVISSTDLHGPIGIAVDAQGIIYVANSTDSSVDIFAAISPTCTTLTATPTSIITGPTTTLNAPWGLALGFVF